MLKFSLHNFARIHRFVFQESHEVLSGFSKKPLGSLDVGELLELAGKKLNKGLDLLVEKKMETPEGMYDLLLEVEKGKEKTDVEHKQALEEQIAAYKRLRQKYGQNAWQHEREKDSSGKILFDSNGNMRLNPMIEKEVRKVSKLDMRISEFKELATKIMKRHEQWSKSHFADKIALKLAGIVPSEVRGNFFAVRDLPSAGKIFELVLEDYNDPSLQAKLIVKHVIANGNLPQWARERLGQCVGKLSKEDFDLLLKESPAVKQFLSNN